jgi:hypothetical protein
MSGAVLGSHAYPSFGPVAKLGGQSITSELGGSQWAK